MCVSPSSLRLNTDKPVPNLETEAMDKRALTGLDRRAEDQKSCGMSRCFLEGFWKSGLRRKSQELDINGETKMLSNRNSRVTINGIFHNNRVITSTSALSDRCFRHVTLSDSRLCKVTLVISHEWKPSNV